MRKLSIFLLLTTMFGISCKRQESKIGSEETTISASFFKDYSDQKLMDSLGNRVNKFGDTAAFNKMKDIYLLSENSKKLLYLSMKMSDDYDFGGASMVTYGILKTDDTTKVNYKLANYYLLKASEEGNQNAKSSIKIRFPSGVIPKSRDYWKTIKK